jgi:FPC/CPF motif-containing protein YcgG
MLRFGFYEDTSKYEVQKLAKDLIDYLDVCRSIGSYTSFVSFFNIRRDMTESEYQCVFWDVLKKLNEVNDLPWPSEIPPEPNEPLWEFSFNNEPIFVVCNTPVHVERRSRYSDTFMITFQPRWVFEAIGINTPSGEKSKSTVRKLLKNYDSEDIFPLLGTYGDPDNREWVQYFVPNSNNNIPLSCPFVAKQDSTSVRYISGEYKGFEQSVKSMLPVTGSVEVQRDTPLRVHNPHTHPTNETLLILEGEITFFVDEQSVTCIPGDRIHLKKNTVHSSRAGAEGCLYVIALEYIDVIE